MAKSFQAMIELEGPPTLDEIEMAMREALWRNKPREANAIAQHLRDAFARNPHKYGTREHERCQEQYYRALGQWSITLTLVAIADFKKEHRKPRKLRGHKIHDR